MVGLVMDKKLAIIINTDESTSLDEEFVQSLSNMQEAVGGFIEPVPLDAATLGRLEAHFQVKLAPGTEAYLNEEGIRLGLELNPLASHLLQRRIIGNVIITHLT